MKANGIIRKIIILVVLFVIFFTSSICFADNHPKIIPPENKLHRQIYHLFNSPMIVQNPNRFGQHILS